MWLKRYGSNWPQIWPKVWILSSVWPPNFCWLCPATPYKGGQPAVVVEENSNVLLYTFQRFCCNPKTILVVCLVVLERRSRVCSGTEQIALGKSRSGLQGVRDRSSQWQYYWKPTLWQYIEKSWTGQYIAICLNAFPKVKYIFPRMKYKFPGLKNMLLRSGLRGLRDVFSK